MTLNDLRKTHAMMSQTPESWQNGHTMKKNLSLKTVSRISSSFTSSTSLIKNLRQTIKEELLAMLNAAELSGCYKSFLSIIEEWGQLLPQLNFLLKENAIDIDTQINLSKTNIFSMPTNKVLRIGFYPISANPLHWGHLLIGFRALVTYRLDKVIFIIAGEDSRKTNLAPAAHRHSASENILKKFSPFLEYSDIAKDSNLDGETNMFKILELNSSQKIDAFYIAGMDHYYRLNPQKGSKDTIQKLEENIHSKIFSYNELVHSVSVIFIDRDTPTAHPPVKTTLSINFVPCLKVQVSSTMIREALQLNADKQALSLIPHSIYQSILNEGVYQ